MVLAIAGVLQAQSLGHWESPRGYAEEGGLDRSTPDDGTVAAWWEHAAGDRRRGIRFRVLALPQPGESRAGSNPARSSPPPNLEEGYVYEASLDAADRGSGSDRAVPYVWSDPEVPEPGGLNEQNEAQRQALALAPTPTAGGSSAAVDVQRTEVPGAVLPTPAPTAANSGSAPAVRSGSDGLHPDQLTREEAIAVLEAAGWPTELHEQALAVIRCESNFRPGAIGDGGNSVGMFQLAWLWFGYAGEDASLWSDPVVNARTAYATYRYDLGRGQAPWQQWTCKP